VIDVVWSPQAQAEFSNAIAHIAKDNPYAARRVQERIESFAASE
jgi:plasmid stabilization system protein ParE